VLLARLAPQVLLVLMVLTEQLVRLDLREQQEILVLLDQLVLKEFKA
jgi:hypothetical protein